MRHAINHAVPVAILLVCVAGAARADSLFNDVPVRSVCNPISVRISSTVVAEIEHLVFGVVNLDDLTGRTRFQCRNPGLRRS